MQARIRRTSSAVAVLIAVLSLTACPDSTSHEGSPSQSAAVSPSPARSTTPPYALKVTVQAGGDCRELADRWEIMGGQNGERPALLGVGGKPVRTESNPPGLIPCQFDFTAVDLPSVDRYFVVDKTINRGWGPWSIETLGSRNWHVTVAITDLD